MAGATALLLLLASLPIGPGTDLRPVPGPSQYRTDDPSASQEAPPVTMRMLLEATIFQIDVLTLELEIGGATGDRLESLARDRDRTEQTVDSIADLAADATRAYARLDFLRDISLDRFLDAVRENAVRAEEADYISPETAAFIQRSLPDWYSFLEGRGIEEGDRMEYFIRGDTLRVQYASASDSLLMDQTDVGPERRRSVLGGYFAPGSDFRDGLLDDLFRRADEEPDAGSPDGAPSDTSRDPAGSALPSPDGP